MSDENRNNYLVCNLENNQIELTTFVNNTNDDNKEDLTEKNDKNKTGIRKDLKTILFLMYLYFLQGIPIGLAMSIPFLLTSRSVSYADQGTFSFAVWPFSIKLLWAPIVDSVFIKKIGRRKTWVILVQFLIGIFMFSFADYVQKLMSSHTKSTEIIILTIIFTLFTFLTATQDVAVDGWALTMLSKENVAWQSTCNGAGQVAGYFISNVLFIVLESTSFCNKYIRPFFNLPLQNTGIVSLKMYMYIFGALFIITALVILIFIKENDPHKNENERLNLINTYKTIWALLKMKPIQSIALILLTVKIGLALESANFLKIIEAGVSKEKLSLLAIPLTPLNIIWPLIINKYTNGAKPLILYMRTLPFRIISGMIITLFIYFTPNFKGEDNDYPFKYYLLCFFVFSIFYLIESTMFISNMAFFASRSDAVIGGTYITLLTTLSNLGGTYPGTIGLFLINFFSVKTCSYQNIATSNNFTSLNSTIEKIKQNNCASTAKIKECGILGGKCLTVFDSFYYLSIGFGFVGLLWLLVFRKRILKLSSTPKSEWKLT